MQSVHLSTIQALFNRAQVDISHIDSLSDEEITKLKKALPIGYKTWDKFLKAAFIFNVEKHISTIKI